MSTATSKKIALKKRTVVEEEVNEHPKPIQQKPERKSPTSLKRERPDMLEEEFEDLGAITKQMETDEHYDIEAEASNKVQQKTKDAPVVQPAPLRQKSQSKHSNKSDPSNNNKYNLFYTSKHHWEDACKPHTVVVASNVEEAYRMLETDLMSTFDKETAKLGDDIFDIMPLTTPGVCIFSIGLGELENVNEEFKKRPIIRKYESISQPDNCSYFVCTTHYTSVVTPASTIIMANSKEEATEFLLRLLKEIGAPDTRDLTVDKLIMTRPTAYFLGRRKKPVSNLPYYKSDEPFPTHKAIMHDSIHPEMMNVSKPHFDNASFLAQLGFSPDLIQ